MSPDFMQSLPSWDQLAENRRSHAYTQQSVLYSLMRQQKGNFLMIFRRIFWSFPRVFQILCWDFRGTQAMDFQNAGFWRLRAPETSIWAPEGAFESKRQFSIVFLLFFRYFFGRIGVDVNKSAASAASLDGFSSRDQVGCWRSLPEDQ